ncbi:MAG: DNA primase [Chloroflexota bacterium]
MGAIDEVKQRTDIVEVIGQYTNLTKAGRLFKGLCPFHSEKHPSFFVYPDQQSWHCFGACGTGGDVFAFVMKKENLDFGEALRRLAERAGVALPSRAEAPGRAEARDRLYQAGEAAAQYYHRLLLDNPAAEKARNYLAGRGFSLETMTAFRLGLSPGGWETLKQHLTERGFTGEELLAAGLVVAGENGQTHDRFRQRLMFPITDLKGRVIGFGGRVLDDAQPKYLNSPQTPLFDKGGVIYAIDKAQTAIRQQDTVVIVEGYMDAITAHQNGFTNTVAAMGTAITERQVSLLKKLTRHIILALDADEAGEEAMLRGVGHENELGAEVRVALLPGGKDPDEVIRGEAGAWPAFLEKAVPVVDYTFDMVTAPLDLTTARDKQLAVERLLPVVAAIKESVRQAHYLQKLARLVGTREARLEAALRDLSQRQVRAARPVARSVQTIFASPLEDYCLALLLQHPELKKMAGGLEPGYFEGSENREIFTAWQQAADLASLRERLDGAIHPRLEALISRSLPPNQVESKYADCVLSLRQRWLRNLEAKRGERLAQEAQTGGAEAALAQLQEQGNDIAIQLKAVFDEKSQRR